jgi:multiple sugar transport system ATP-binding protein
MSSLRNQESSNQIQAGGRSGNDVHLQISNVTKRFGNVTACEDINIDISSDEFIIFLGPSGCGKTTTLRCLAGLENPDEGVIRIDDENITNKKPKDRNLAFVFQNIALFPHMSVARNIRFGLDMQTDLSAEEKNQRIQEAAEMLGIADKLDRKPSALSGGQQQRVSLGRAMVMEPEAFLLDEPFSALDAKLRDQLRIEVQKLQQRLDLAMIFVTHDQEEAMMLGDRIVIMNNGRIEQIGTPAEIYNDPSNQFVADFIGSPATNFIECTIDQRDKGVTLRTDLFSLPLAPEQAKKLDTGVERATMGIRPHKLNLAPTESHFEADVTVVEPHGDRDAVYLQAGDWEPTILTESGHCKEGETVEVELTVENTWLFANNGDRLC